MAEAYPLDATLNALTSDSETGVEYITTGEAPYYLSYRKELYRTLIATKRANDLRVFDEGGLNIGVKAGKFWDGTTLREYSASAGNTLADDKANIYVYINSAGTLVITEYNDFPDESEPHLRLAQITTASGDITTLTDIRGQQMWFMPGMAIKAVREKTLCYENEVVCYENEMVTVY